MGLHTPGRPLERYRTALESADPLVALRNTVARELQSADRDQVLRDLETLRTALRHDGRNEDTVLDVMDFVTGWSSPHMRL